MKVVKQLMNTALLKLMKGIVKYLLDNSGVHSYFSNNYYNKCYPLLETMQSKEEQW